MAHRSRSCAQMYLLKHIGLESRAILTLSTDIVAPFNCGEICRLDDRGVGTASSKCLNLHAAGIATILRLT